MATAKLETAADKYRRIKREKLQPQTVPCPECNFEWKVRRAEKSFWVTSGILPTSMLDMVATIAKGGAVDEAEAIKNLATDEIVSSIVFSNKVVKYTAVEPRIVEEVKEPNDISQDEVDLCCYNFLRDWQMKGGDEAKRLENFPEE